MADPLLNASLLKPQTVGTSVSEDAMTAAARGQAAFGGAIKDAGSAIERVALQRQEAENAATMADLRRDLREHAAEVERRMIEQPDEKQWLDHWNREMDSFEGRFTQQEGLSPQVRREIEIYFNDFRSKGAMDVQTKALRQTFARAEERGLMDAESALAHGDLDGALGAVNAIPGKLPEWKERMGRNITQKHDMNVMEATMETDPWAMDDMEKPDWMTDGKWAKTQTARERKKNQLVTESARDISERVQGDHIISKDMINDMIDQDPILAQVDETERNRLRSALLENAPLTEAEMSGSRAMIQSLRDLRQDPNIGPELYEETYHFQMASLSMYGNRQGARDLREELAQLSPDMIAQKQQNATDNRIDWQKNKLYSDWHAATLPMKDPAEAERVNRAAKQQMDLLLEATPAQTIIDHDNARSPGDPTWIEKKGREIWTNLQVGKGRQQISDIVWDEPGENVLRNPDQGALLPPKNNLLGRPRGQ